MTLTGCNLHAVSEGHGVQSARTLSLPRGARFSGEREGGSRVIFVVGANFIDASHEIIRNFNQRGDGMTHAPLSQTQIDHRADFASFAMDPSGKCGGVLRRLHCLCLELNGACEGQCRVPTVWIIEPVDVSGYGGFSLAS